MDRNLYSPSTESMPRAGGPAFGEPMPIVASPPTAAFLASRRSASALSLAAPAPFDDEVLALLTIAARVPDHGKLAPWRFVLFAGEAKARFVAGLREADNVVETELDVDPEVVSQLDRFATSAVNIRAGVRNDLESKVAHCGFGGHGCISLRVEKLLHRLHA